MLIEAARSLLLVVDVQARLFPAVPEGDASVRQCRTLIQAARRLRVPVLATEQYPEGLGPTIPALAELLEPGEVMAKRHFACTGEPHIVAALAARTRSTIVLCGMETHVCVLQSALGLLGLGYEPVVVADAVASRQPVARNTALQRLRRHGVEIVTTEMVVFEWLRVADTEDFRALLPLLR